MPASNFQPIGLLDPDCWYKFTHFITNSADPDQLASVKILIITQAFIRIITFHKEGGGCLLEATVFDDSWKNFEIFKFSCNVRHIDIGNGSIY